MAKVIVGGVGKKDVEVALKGAHEPDLEVVVSNDMAAAMQLKSGQADYFLGTCHTGAGASLGVLVALLGKTKCHTFGRTVPSLEEFTLVLDEGKVAFGFSIDQADKVVPTFVQALRTRRP
jgi:hypothetical protein